MVGFAAMTIKNAAKLVMLVVSLLAAASFAQFPPGTAVWDVKQNGVLVGQLYVEGSGANYTEHWVLWPGYVTPTSSIEVEVKMGSKTYAKASDFFKQVSFPSGSKYVKANCNESAQLP